MDKKDFRFALYKMFYENKDYSLAEFLNNSSCDELIEVNLKDDTFKQYYHVDNKYFVPGVIAKFSDLRDFASNHVVHIDDKTIYDKLMDPKGFFERLKNNEIPNFDYIHIRYKLQDGSYRYVENAVLAGKENGIPEGSFRLYIFDIQNIKDRQLGKLSGDKEIKFVDRNSITGLLNANAFVNEANKKIAEPIEGKWCLINIDIEHFKFFDEWYGRDTGDFLLGKIGAVLSEHEKEYNAVAGYQGQDDFSFLMPFNKQKIEHLYESVRDVIVNFGFSVGFMPAFGVAILEKGNTVIDAFDKASIATTRAKKDIRNRISIFDAKMQQVAEQEYKILSDYMNAFKNDEITFYLQPQCRISNAKIVGAESLARWIKKDGTIVPPNDYIPILEKYGFITDLDQRLWEKVCIWLRSWLDKGHQAVPISVNVSRTDIYTIDVLKHFQELTKKYNIPHNLIKLEITESAYTETTKIIGDLVKKLRADRFLVLMDDFGSGYSSLNMLSNLKVDAIKLDTHFLHIDGADIEKGIHILESVINMAKQIAIPIIVEGVETKSQADFLDDLGCRYAQGYYFYRPIPITHFEKLIGYKANIDDKGFVVKLNEQFRIREFLDKNIYSDSMLNNIIGPVALYQVRDGEHIDIVRFNQQFYEAVDVPDFHEKLENIENTMSNSDRIAILSTFRKAKENKLNGASGIFKFDRIDGTKSHFLMHLYYLGVKEGYDRFYGSARNVSEYIDLKEQLDMISYYSHDNLIFIKQVYNKWVYSVASHGLSDILDLSPKQLEVELNNGEFAKRVVDRKELAKFMHQVHTLTENKEDFERTFEVRVNKDEIIRLKLRFYNISDKTTNIKYIMIPEKLDY